MIKGLRVEQAINTIHFSTKRMAPVVEKVLQSAIANAAYVSEEQGLDVDVDNLYVHTAIANEGPRMKRIRPAPMGRAFRYQRRLCHIIVTVAEKGKGGAGRADQAGQPHGRLWQKKAEARRRRKTSFGMRGSSAQARRGKLRVWNTAVRLNRRRRVKGSYGTESPSVWVSPRHQQAVEVALVCGARLRQAAGRGREAEG